MISAKIEMRQQGGRMGVRCSCGDSRPRLSGRAKLDGPFLTAGRLHSQSRRSPYLGSGSFRFASAYAITAIAAAFSRSSAGTTLSRVSAAVW